MERQKAKLDPKFPLILLFFWKQKHKNLTVLFRSLLLFVELLLKRKKVFEIYSACFKHYNKETLPWKNGSN